MKSVPYTLEYMIKYHITGHVLGEGGLKLFEGFLIHTSMEQYKF